MVFGRKKGDPMIDSFGPLDTLIAASQTLVGGQRDFVNMALLSDEFVDAAVESGRALPRSEVERLNQVCRIGFASATSLARLRSSDFSTEMEAAKLLVAGCLQTQPHQINLIEYREGFALALTAIRGGTRMIQLRRDDQAMVVIALGTMLARFACLGGNESTDVYVVTWGDSGENKCTFYVKPDLSISWTPETNEPELFAQDHPLAALSELELALGKVVSFPERLSANNDFFQSLIESGAATFEATDEPYFKWNPPLPDSGNSSVD
jgi:hypothetical protein